MKRWRHYFEQLLNTVNENIDEQQKENKILNTKNGYNDITIEEMKRVIRKLKSGKASLHDMTKLHLKWSKLGDKLEYN